MRASPTVTKPACIGLLLAVSGVTAWLMFRGDMPPPPRRETRVMQETARALPVSFHPSPADSDPVLTRLRQEAADTSDRLGAEHPRTLARRTRFAQWLNSQGRYAEAEAEHRAVLQIRLRTLGPEHPDTLNSRKFLAAPLFSQGKYSAARAEYDAVLAVRWPNGETDEPGWVAIWREMMSVWFSKGLRTEPHDVYLAALDSMARVLLLDNTESVGLAPRAVVLDHLGHHAEAEEDLRADSMAKHVGPEDPHTLRARHFVDSALNGQGRYAEVEANERDILAIQERVLGAEHEDVFATRLFLATSLRDQDKFDEARKEATAAFAGFQKVRGDDDPATVAARQLLEDIDAPR